MGYLEDNVLFLDNGILKFLFVKLCIVFDFILEMVFF